MRSSNFSLVALRLLVVLGLDLLEICCSKHLRQAAAAAAKVTRSIALVLCVMVDLK